MEIIQIELLVVVCNVGKELAALQIDWVGEALFGFVCKKLLKLFIYMARSHNKGAQKTLF